MKILGQALCLGIVSLFLFSCPARSGTISITDNFDGLAADAFVTDDSNWTTTDLWQNNGVIANGLGKAGWLGGLYDSPTTTTTYLARSFDAQDNNRFTFRWTQNIANASTDDGIRDRFGWTVKSTTGDSLLTLMFNNVGLPGQNLLAQGYRGSLAGTAISSSSGLGVSNRGEWAQFEIVLNTEANTWSASLFNATANGGEGAWQSFITNGTVNGSGYTVGGFSAVWDLQDKTTTISTRLQDLDNDPNTPDVVAPIKLQDGTPVTLYSGAGQNIMMFDSLTVSGVPEPSSLSLFALGSLAVLAARRRSS